MITTMQQIIQRKLAPTDEMLHLENFREKFIEVMREHRERDQQSGYQMYYYPDFDDFHLALLTKCESVNEFIDRCEIEYPDGWSPEFLRHLSFCC